MPQSARILTPACPKPAVPLDDCQREYGSHSLHLSTKIPVNRADIIPTLLYGAETWILYQKQIRLLERFHQRFLCSILGIKWQDHVSNKEVLKRASLPTRESILLHVQLHWNGHITRMEDVCMPRAGLATSHGWKMYTCPKQSSSANSKKESAIVVLQESITKIS